jgi:CheY-like chemotaxis protein
MPTEAKGLRVLIVDDERVIADTLALILRSRGFTVNTAYSGEDAVELAEAMRPDVLISDVVMGPMSGVEAAIAICGELPDCRVILISGQLITADLLKEATARGHDFEVLIKPVHPQLLLDRLRLSQA